MVRRGWTVGLALVVPLLVLAAAAFGLLSLEDLRDRTARRLAGKEVEGKVRPEGVVAYIDQQMGRRPQYAVVVGDSLAHSDVHHEPLAKQLGVHPATIARISIPGSGAATWYAILDNHVFGKGHQPEWIVVVGSLPSLLEMRPASPPHEVTLRALLDGDDPLVEARLQGGAPAWWDDLRIARAKARTRFLDLVRGGSVGWAFGPAETDRVEWGAARADLASARVFDERQVDLHLTRSILADVDPRLEVADLDSLPAVRDSWVPDLVALAQRHGARIAFAKPPVSPTMPPEGWDRTTPAMQQGFAEVTAGPEAVFYDDSRLDMSPVGFRDLAHMGEALSRRYGMLLGGRLALGASEAQPGTSVLDRGELDAREGPVPTAPPSEPGTARTERFDLSFLRPLVDRAILAGFPVSASCLPFVAVQDGEVLPPHPDGCAGVLHDEAPAVCFDGTHLWARADEDGGPVTLERHPTGRCEDGRRWLRPGQALRWKALGSKAIAVQAVSTHPMRMSLDVAGSGARPLKRRWGGKHLDRKTFDLPPVARKGVVRLSNQAPQGLVLVLDAKVP